MFMITTQYAAGFFDGEGTVHIDRVKRKRGRHYDYYLLRVKISNTNRDILQEFLSRWGGGISAFPLRLGHKQAWYWYISSKRAAAFLKDIHKHTKVKHKVIAVGLRLDSMMKMGGRHIVLTEDQLQARIDAYIEVRALNKRGASDKDKMSEVKM